MCVAARLVKGLSSGANTWKSLEHCRAAIMMPARIHSSSLMLEHTHRARGSRGRHGMGRAVDVQPAIRELQLTLRLA